MHKKYRTFKRNISLEMKCHEKQKNVTTDHEVCNLGSALMSMSRQNVATRGRLTNCKLSMNGCFTSDECFC